MPMLLLNTTQRALHHILITGNVQFCCRSVDQVQQVQHAVISSLCLQVVVVVESARQLQPVLHQRWDIKLTFSQPMRERERERPNPLTH